MPATAPRTSPRATAHSPLADRHRINPAYRAIRGGEQKRRNARRGIKAGLTASPPQPH